MYEPDDAATPHLISSMLTEQDKDTAEEDKAEIVERMALVPNDEATEVAQPGEEPFNLPTALEATEWSAILGLWFLSVAAMRRNHLHPQPGQLSV
jgi:hypothetical protein